MNPLSSRGWTYFVLPHLQTELPEARLCCDQEVGCAFPSPGGLTNQIEKLEVAVNFNHYLHGTFFSLKI